MKQGRTVAYSVSERHTVAYTVTLPHWRWQCSCGAERDGWRTFELAHADAEQHDCKESP